MSKILKTWIPYHPDECPGGTHIYNAEKEYNIIFECNECGEKRTLVLTEEGSLPCGMFTVITSNDIQKRS